MELTLAPGVGGAVAGLTFDGAPLLRPWDGTESVRRMAAYPLVPYSNRIAEGKFKFGGREFQLARNFGDHPHPLHGLGWQRAWQLEDGDDFSARVRLLHTAEGEGAAAWPFPFEAVQSYRVAEDRVDVEMSLRNLGAVPAPAGLGWHPFFPGRDTALLQFEADTVWINDARMVPAAAVALPPSWDFRSAAPVGRAVGLDNCFDGFGGEAVISWPSRPYRVRLGASDTLGRLVVMVVAPAVGDFFAVEPVSNANNALNQPDPVAHGMTILPPGGAMEVRMSISVMAGIN
jgi:aldose 1-epimerase